MAACEMSADSDVLISTGEKIINQRGFTVAHIDDRGATVKRHLLYENERSLKVGDDTS